MDYSSSRASMMRVARVFVRTAEDAEDVVQETWLAVLAGVDRFQRRSSFNTWVYRILVNRARSHARRNARMVPLSQSNVDVSQLPARAADPAQQVLNAEVRSKIQTAIALLPHNQQRVISLRDVEGRSADDVCEMLRLSPAHQRVLLHRARTRVRSHMRPYFAE